MTSIEKAKKPHNYGNLYQYLLWLSIFLLVFEDPIQQCFPIFGYYDEVFALFGGLYYLFSRRSKVFLGIWWLIVLYVTAGLMSSCLYSTQPILACIGDTFLNLKFYLAMAFGLAASNDFVSVHREKMILIVRFLTYCLTGLLLLNFVFNWFPGQEFRFGIAIPKLFFSHSEYLAGAVVSRKLV